MSPAVYKAKKNSIEAASTASNSDITLSSEQRLFIDHALSGKNILVDACIGSGKTTAIQHLCNTYPTSKKILYLTYNKLLKLDAKSKIKNSNVVVTNYHGYAYSCLMKAHIHSVGISDIIQAFINYNPPVGHFDVMVIDEYQDIEQELATMLWKIKQANPNMQIIAVGDMQQKIYDKTTLDVKAFIEEFLGDYISLEFTRCFRLSKKHAAMLGRVWNKSIVGANPKCEVSTMTISEAVDFLKQQDPSKVLCLGARYGDLSRTLNILETECPEKYNKNTIFASIRDDDTERIEPRPDTGIFTTFDSSKGLEKEICMVFDFTEDYWLIRVRKPQVNYEILRNIFCVAASRGKNKIIFVKGSTPILSEKTLSSYFATNQIFDNMNISEMFDFKYKEDIEECYKLLNIKKEHYEDTVEIEAKLRDGFIDLSPCLGIFLESSYFDGFDLADELNLIYSVDSDLSDVYRKEFAKRAGDIQGQILVIVAAQTHLIRYINQVKSPFVDKLTSKAMRARLSSVFSQNELVQAPCSIDIEYMDTDPVTGKNKKNVFYCMGHADVVKDDTVYELKFVSDLRHEHFLQCACYMYALGLDKGVLWNIRTNEKYRIKIKDKDEFVNKVVKTITKGYLG